MKRRISISLRLTLWFGSIFFTGWALFGIGMGANLSHTLRNERRLTLSRRIDRLQDLLLKDQSAPSAGRSQDFADFAHATGNGLMEVFLPNGVRAFPSPSSAAKAFPWPQVDLPDTSNFVRVPSAGQSYWVMARPFALQGRPLVLMAAAPEAGNILVMENFLRGLLASFPILLIVSSAGGYWLSRRALRPVDSITATARSISIGNVSERIPVSSTGDELQRLSETCNAMLDRLEASVSQIKRFTADASHELRGPLAFTRTVAELALQNPQLDSDSRRAFHEIVEEVATAAVLLDDMLTLARADSLPITLPRTQVDLVPVLQEVSAMARTAAAQHGLQLTTRCDTTRAIVLGDAAMLKRLLWILLDNAIKYSRSGGTIEILLNATPSATGVIVRDDGIGIAPADLPFVFDRFYRADPSRGIVEGNGLGLAIAKWIAEIHQARISVASDPRHGTSFTIDFPPQSSPADHSRDLRDRAYRAMESEQLATRA